MNNGIGLDNEFGGGVVNKGTVTLSKEVIIYNNHAMVAGDDIYNYEGATIKFNAVGSQWILNGGKKHDGMTDCEDKINGWYDDNKENRWEAHGETLEDDYINEVKAGEYHSELAIKAAHDKLKGTFSKDKNEILFKDYGINYNNEPEVYKKGTLLVRLKNNENKSKYPTDELLYKDDPISKAMIFNEQTNVVVCHSDLVKDDFWNKEIIDFE